MHRLFILVALFILTLLSLIVLRPEIYRSYQHAAYTVGINLNNIAQDSYVSWIKSQAEQDRSEAIFLNKKVRSDGSLATDLAVLGDSSNVDDSKWIEVDLSEQRLYMKQNGNNVGSFLVSTGKWSPTPKGEWRIWTKLRYTRMRGGSKALGTFYDLPNVPYTMYYYQGYGIHGAYWHSNFGQPMSHGCVNMKPEEAGVVFNFASVGTKVIVHD